MDTNNDWPRWIHTNDLARTHEVLILQFHHSFFTLQIPRGNDSCSPVTLRPLVPLTSCSSWGHSRDSTHPPNGSPGCLQRHLALRGALQLCLAPRPGLRKPSPLRREGRGASAPGTSSELSRDLLGASPGPSRSFPGTSSELPQDLLEASLENFLELPGPSPGSCGLGTLDSSSCP